MVKNNLYQVELENEIENKTLKGYIVTEQENNFIGILYTGARYVFNYIYGKYVSNDKVEIFIDGVLSGEYKFNEKLFARDMVPYEVYIPINNQNIANNKFLIMHYDLNLGFEADRVSDISNFVNLEFGKHVRRDEEFSETYNEYLGDTYSFHKRKRFILDDEELPF